MWHLWSIIFILSSTFLWKYNVLCFLYIFSAYIGSVCHKKELYTFFYACMMVLKIVMANASLMVCTDEGWSNEIQVFTLANSGMQTVAFWKIK